MVRMTERVLLAIAVMAGALLFQSAASATDEPIGLCVNYQCAHFVYFDMCLRGGVAFQYPDCNWCATGRCIGVNKLCWTAAGAPEQFYDVTNVQDVCDCNLAPPSDPRVQASGNYSGPFTHDTGRKQMTCQ
jgi:hypothetical protein